MTFLSDEFMLDILSKVQPLQADILKSGRSAHIDASVHDCFWDPSDTHISFDVTVFRGNTLVENFEFSSVDTEEKVKAVLVSLVAYVNSL